MFRLTYVVTSAVKSVCRQPVPRRERPAHDEHLVTDQSFSVICLRAKAVDLNFQRFDILANLPQLFDFAETVVAILLFMHQLLIRSLLLLIVQLRLRVSNSLDRLLLLEKHEDLKDVASIRIFDFVVPIPLKTFAINKVLRRWTRLSLRNFFLKFLQSKRSGLFLGSGIPSKIYRNFPVGYRSLNWSQIEYCIVANQVSRNVT